MVEIDGKDMKNWGVTLTGSVWVSTATLGGSYGSHSSYSFEWGLVPWGLRLEQKTAC